MSAFREDVLSGRVALVTGGATGIGKEIARTLGLHGARVFICSRKVDRLEKSTAELRAEGIDCAWHRCDVRDPDSVSAAVENLLGRGHGLDIVVNNAAGNFPAPISRISPKGFRTVVDIDLLGTYNVSKIAVDAWLRDNGGSIVNISAPFEGKGAALQSHVAAAKAAVDSLTRTCAVEWGRHGIRVNGIAPGHVADTEGVARFTAAAGASGPERIPLGRVGVARDIANSVLFLSTEAASYISGQVWTVDGASSVDQIGMAGRLADMEANWPERES
ncbi:MAG: SDR family oxidoreductase [Proteobacteria bacterium]|nr:SDR family oxidoreductase [Pseudomonadota bacterium]